MFDTMVITKTVAALCAALLFFLLANWGASAIYLPAAHGDDHAHAVYPLPVEGGEGEAPAAPADPDAGIDVLALYETADSAAGAALWRNCQSCHKLDGTNGTGPHLDGVVGRAIDAVDGYNYSGALLALGDTWSVENLFRFLRDPRGTAPGTRMSFRGLSSPEDRVNLIRYLEDHPG